ncbi:reverse transcriptase [Tanacetum coccineum]
MFIGGLKPEVGTPMRMFQANNLSESYQLAKMQEATNTILKPRYNTPLLPAPKQSTTTFASKAVTTPVKSNLVGQSNGYVTRNGVHNPYKLTQKELEEKRAKGQCFYCDQKFVPGHKCNSQLHSIEVICEGDIDNCIDGDDDTYEDCVGEMGRVGKKVVHILIDCGIIRNFLDIHQAKKFRCKLAKTTPMQVSVANGQRMMSTFVCHDLKWSLQNECNFKKLIMKFNHKGRQLVLRVINTTHLCQMESVGSVSAEVEQVLTQFDEVFEVPKDLPPQRSHDHQIPLMTNTPPINVRPYRYPPNKKDSIESMVKELMDSGVVRASQSPFSSPIVMVKKKDGTWRMCIDYKQLNKYTVKDKFPIPVIEELIDRLNGFVVFSKLDLRSGYHQIRMKEDDICKTAFRTHEGYYEFLVMPFGLTNAPLTFQSLMNTVFKAFLRKFVLVFFDDILIYSKNLEQHLEYLGHIISAQGVATNPSKIEAMQKWLIPSTLKQLRGFLGLTGYYRRFLKDYVIITQPLVALTKKDAFKWNPSAELAYHQLKEAMVTAPVLALPNFEQEFIVEIDATLSTYEKEFLAVVAVLDKWKGYLLDRHIKIRIDHSSQKYLLNQKLTTPFLFKWLPKLLGYDYEIVYKKGSENVMWRIRQVEGLLLIGHFKIRTDHFSLKRAEISVSSVSSSVWDKEKSFSPSTSDEAIGGHSECSVNMKKLGFIKPDLSVYPGLIQPLPIPERIWKEVFMDFIEKLPTSHGKSVIVVVVDRLSKYAHFISLAHPFTASQVAQDFLDQVYKLHGLPKSIVSDRDKVFLSNFWKALFDELKVKLKLSTAYHPQTDGQTKVVNRSLGCYLRSMCGEKPKEWVKWLPLAEFYRVEEVDRILQAREEAIKVYLKLQPHRQVSIRQGQQHKLSSKYYGPFKVAERIREVAYRLKLPSSSQIHLVFHISQLKKCHGKDHSMGVLPQLREDGLLENKPMAILERRLGKVNNKPVMFVLIQWTNKPVEEATWEIYGDLITRFPGFDAVNEAIP